MPGGQSGTVQTNTVQNADPWSGAQPYLRYGLNQAYQAYNRGPYGFVPTSGQAPAGSSPFTMGGGSLPGAAPMTQAQFIAQGGNGHGLFGGGTQAGQELRSQLYPGYLSGFTLPDGSLAGGQGTQGAQGQQQQQGYVDPAAFLTAQSPYTLQAQQMQAAQALDPNSLTGRAQGLVGNELSGQYLNPGTNPAWAPMSQRITDAYSTGTAAQTDAAAARANALGGSGYNQQTQLNQRALGDSLAGLAGNLYNTERGYQQNAIGQAPNLQLANINQLANVGAAQEARGQAQIGAQQQAYASPWSNLEMFRNLISGTGGGTTTGSTQNPYFTNPAASYLGLGIGGLGLYNGLSGIFAGGAAGGGAASLSPLLFAG